MSQSTKQKRENFRKEIRKQQIEKKKNSIRRELPYYEEMFKQIDDSSNGTNSRSSRFPIRSGSSKEKTDTFGSKKPQQIENQQQKNDNEKLKVQEKQRAYLQYLKNLNCTLSPQDKVLLEKSLIHKYGQNCFLDMEKLKEKIHCDLLTYEMNAFSQQNLNILHEEDWIFVIASFKLAQNQHFQQISKSAFSLMTGSFNQWHCNNMKKVINDHKSQSIDAIFDAMNDISEIEIKIEEIILSKLIGLCSQQIDTQSFTQNFLMITKYLLQKMEIFNYLEKQLLKHYDVEETQNFSEMIFNFGFFHAIKILAYVTQNGEVDFELRINVYNVVSKYFTMYPINVMSETQTDERFNQFMYDYLNSVIGFFEEFSRKKNPNFPISPQNPIFQFFKSSQLLIMSLLWRENTQQLCYNQIYIIYTHLINSCLKSSQLITKVQHFITFHTIMIEFSLSFYAFIEGSKSLFTEKQYLQYVHLLNLYLHEFKMKQRNTLSYERRDEAFGEWKKLLVMESYLIYALNVIKKLSESEECTQKDQRVQQLFEYAEFVYKKQYHILEKYNYAIAENIHLIFMPNVLLYFKLFVNVQKKENDVNPEKNEHHEGNHYEDEVQI